MSLRRWERTIREVGNMLVVSFCLNTHAVFLQPFVHLIPSSSSLS